MSTVDIERTPPGELQPGVVYSFDDLGTTFRFKPGYFQTAGGMLVSTKTNSVLLITHPDGGKTFDYSDHWEGGDLIYTGRGQTGDQKREGANLYVAENLRDLYVFEADEPRYLRFLGQARCIEESIGRALDGDEVMRDVIRFRLRFETGGNLDAKPTTEIVEAREPQSDARVTPERQPRPFNAERRPATAETGTTRSTPEETAALQEKARQDHHDLLAVLNARLVETEWTEVEEIPAAIDLWGVAPSGTRVLFEAKTISDGTEATQCRGALAQLLEYRLEFGAPDDRLCMVVNRRLSSRRAEILDHLGIAVIEIVDEGLVSRNENGRGVMREIAHAGAAGQPLPSTITRAEEIFKQAQRRLAVAKRDLDRVRAAIKR